MMHEGLVRSRTRKVLVAAIAVTAVLIAGVAVAERSSDERRIGEMQAAAGRVWYDKYCASCHGPGGGPGSAVYQSNGAPVDLRRYVVRHDGHFPAGDWIAVVEQVDMRSPHASVWEQIRREQQLGTSAQAAAARGIVVLIAEYVRSVQTK